LHITDRLILGMWQTFESVRHLSVASVISHWSAAGARPGSGAGAGKAFDALQGMDAGRMMATCTSFPLRRSLAVQDPQSQSRRSGERDRGEEWEGEGTEKDTSNSKNRPYDPVFVLSLLGAVLSGAEEYTLSGLDWVEVVRSDALGVVVCALAARDEGLRRLAGWVLGRVVFMCQVSTSGVLHGYQGRGSGRADVSSK
jgi:nucleolar pre-ribosomal-associated protein 1